MTEERPQSKRIRALAMLFAAAIALECVLFYILVGRNYSLVESPKTPRTVAGANRLFSEGIQPGQVRRSVEDWLASQGIKRGNVMMDAGIIYDVLLRRDNPTSNEMWMDGIGNETVAEYAGLDKDSVFSVIRVSYPDAARFSSGLTSVTVYLFFDKNDRLLRHWVSEFHVMP